MIRCCSRCQLPTDVLWLDGRCVECRKALGLPVEGIEAFDDAPAAPPDTLSSILTSATFTSWGMGGLTVSVDTEGIYKLSGVKPAETEKPTFERFTDRARKSMQLAQQEAQRFNHEYIEPLHVLVGLMKEGSGVAANVLKRMCVDLASVRRSAEKLLTPSEGDQVIIGRLPRAESTDAALLRATEEAKGLGHTYVGTEHMLLGLLNDPTTSLLLAGHGLTAQGVRDEIVALLKPKSAAADAVRNEHCWFREMLRIMPQKAMARGASAETAAMIGELCSEAWRLFSTEPL